MKKIFTIIFVSIIGLFIFVAALDFSKNATGLDSQNYSYIPTNSAYSPSATGTISNGKEYRSLNGELSIVIPEDYVVATQYGHRTFLKDGADPYTIFIATTSKNLLAIRKKAAKGDTSLSQIDAVRAVYNFAIQNPGPHQGYGTSEVTQTNWRTGYLGQNDYAINDGKVTEHSGLNSVTRTLRQYYTYYDHNDYYIEFQTYFPNSKDATSLDQIVSTIKFK